MNEVVQNQSDIGDLLKSPNISRETKDWARDELSQIQYDIDLLLLPNGFQEHLVDYVKQEYESYNSDGERTEPLCQCRNSGCDLLHGRLPSCITNSDDLDTGLLGFKRRHSGEPSVLIEARETWSDRRQRVLFVQRTVISALVGDEPVQIDAPKAFQ